MWVKILLVLFLVPSACFAVEVNKEKFNQMIEREVLECRESERLLMDPMDVNTFYWLQGKAHGLLESKRILEQAQVRQQ